MKLYEIAKDFQALFDELENMTENEEMTAEEKADTEQAWFDTLEGIECEFKDKAENVAAYIKLLKFQTEALAKEEKALAARRRSKEKHAENLKAYLLENMNKVSLKKLDSPMAVLTVRNNAESAVVEDEAALIRWAQENADDILRYKAPEINRTELKKLLQAGSEIPFAHLAKTQSLIIR